MGILLDIGLVIIVLICVVFGYKKGFFKSITSFIGAALAMFLAWTLGGLIANAMYQGIFRGMLADQISQVLSNGTLGSIQEQTASIIQALPDFLRNTLHNMGITSSQIENNLATKNAAVAETTADILSPAVIWLLQLLLTVILFFILFVFVRLAVKLLGNIFRWPVLRQADGIAGAVFGIFKGIIYVFLACVLLYLIMPLTGSSAASVKQVLNSSYICRFIFMYNPITSWFV